MKRIFIAADISEEARARAAEYTTRLREDDGYKRMKPVEPKNLHLTLKFLGEISEFQVGELKTVVRNAAAAAAPFTIEIAGAGVFESRGNSRVMWLGVRDPNEDLAAIARSIDDECAVIGFPKQKGKLKPHLTIARLRDPNVFDDLIQIHLMNKFEPVSFPVTEIVIYESILSPAGPKYSKIHTEPLAG